MEKLTGHYRRHRFQSLGSVQARQNGQPDPCQQGYDEGFRQGQERGLQQGLADGFSQGEQQGYQEGLKRGHSQGEQAGRETFEQALAPLAQLQKGLESLRQQSLTDHTDNLCHLVEQVARRVIQAELSLNPEQILKLVEEAIGRMDTRKGPVTVYLSPDDHERLAKIGRNRIGEYPIHADDQLSGGDCRLESDQQQLLVRSEDRLQSCVAKVRDELEQES